MKTSLLAALCAAFLLACGGASEATDEPADASVEAAPLSCSAGLRVCAVVDAGHACVDTFRDAANCGGCGLRCATGQTCSAGACR